MKSKKNNNTIVSLGIVLAGFLHLLKLTGLIDLDIREIYGYIFIIFGLASVYVNLNSGKRGVLFISTIVFMTGINLLVMNYYELLDFKKVIPVSVMFILGTGFLVIFFENIKEKIFLISGLSLIVLSILFISVIHIGRIIPYSNEIGLLIFSYWPIFVIIIGTGLLIKSKI